MKALAFTQTSTAVGVNRLPTRRRLMAKMQMTGAVVGLTCGVGSGLLGAPLIVAGWLAVSKDVRHWLSVTGSILLFLTIPLIILGACCLDWLEKDRPQHRPKVVRYEDDDEENEG